MYDQEVYLELCEMFKYGNEIDFQYKGARFKIEPSDKPILQEPESVKSSVKNWLVIYQNDPEYKPLFEKGLCELCILSEEQVQEMLSVHCFFGKSFNEIFANLEDLYIWWKIEKSEGVQKKEKLKCKNLKKHLQLSKL